ncbi:hypothetical protein NDU88_009068 [Pleurodeles waltl]|uniref:Uncharacterized protein n=1 Tax=Pleurodeles waltl TaxID=8319 RepID=A0AAV7QRU5_PLEWA|nr:hypothetical protein NDU88_009068 [Pleurodeles waltl]
MVGFTPSLLLHVLRGNWAHFWCPKIVCSARSLCPPRRFTYFAGALPQPRSPTPPSTSEPGSHQHCFLSLCLDVPVSCKGGTQYGLCGAAPVARDASINPLWLCPVLRSPASLPRCGCRARTDTAGGPHTRALYQMHCSVFSARSGRDRPSTSSSGKRQSRRQDRVTTQVPGLGDGRGPRKTGSSDAPYALGSGSPSFLEAPRAPGYRLSESRVPEGGLFSRIDRRPFRNRVFKRAPSWLPGHAP